MLVFKEALNLFSQVLVYLKLNASWVNFCMCPLQLGSILPRTNLRTAEGEVRHVIIKDEVFSVSQMRFSFYELYVISHSDLVMALNLLPKHP